MDIRAYAHHGFKPAKPNPPASLLTGYPGWPLPTPNGVIPWPSAGTSGAAGPWVCWCELAKKSDVETANFAGPGWIPNPPPAPDEWYADTAFDFSVNKIRILSPTMSPGLHEYTIRTPGGALAAVITPQSGVPASFEAAVAVPSGRGIWTIEIRRLPNSFTATPDPLIGPPTVEEPLVGVFGPAIEGLLRLQFTGDEVTQKPCPTDVTIEAQVETSPGSGQYNQLKAGDCIEPGRNVTFTANIVPTGTPGVQYKFDFGDGTSSGFSSSNTATHTYAQPAAGMTCMVTAWIPSSPCFPLTNSITLVIDCCGGGTWDAAKGQCVACPSGVTIGATPPSGCAPGSVGNVTLTATPPPGLPPGATYSWSIDGPTSAATVHATRSNSPGTVPSSSGWSGLGTSSGAVVFSDPGTYSVSVSVQYPGGGNCVLLSSTSFLVESCCPDGQHWDAAQRKCVPDGPSPTSPPTTPTPTSTNGNTDGGSFGCGALLIIALILLLIGTVLIIVGVCTATPQITVAGVIVVAIALILFALWAFFCSRVTACSLMQKIHCILFWFIAVVMPVLAILLTIFGGLACGAAAAASWAGWATIFAWLGHIMMLRGCPRRC